MSACAPANARSFSDLLERTTMNTQAPSVKEDRPSIPIDVKEDASEYVVYADIPGVDEDEIDIRLVGDILTISGERSFDHDNEDAEDYVRLERPYGPFERSLNIPAGLNSNGMTAKYKRGVLKVRVPKTGARPK